MLLPQQLERGALATNAHLGLLPDETTWIAEDGLGPVGLTALRGEQVVLKLRDANSSALVREATDERSRHVVMPLRL